MSRTLPTTTYVRDYKELSEILDNCSAKALTRLFSDLVLLAILRQKYCCVMTNKHRMVLRAHQRAWQDVHFFECTFVHMCILSTLSKERD